MHSITVLGIPRLVKSQLQESALLISIHRRSERPLDLKLEL